MKGAIGLVGPVAVLGLIALQACARPDVRTPVRPDDYLFPAWEPGDVRPEEGREIEKAWSDVLAGRTRRASRRLQELLRSRPALVSAETALAYSQLRAGDLAAAQASFGRTLERRPEYAPALTGAASVALRRGDPDAALDYLSRALLTRPDDAQLARRLGELKVQVVEARGAAARRAAAAGDADTAEREYRRALEVAPELAVLRLELGEWLVAAGRLPEAVAVLRAVPDDDRHVLLRLSQLLRDAGDTESVLAVYRRLLAQDGDDAEVRESAHELARWLEEQATGPEYRRIPGAARITRADLAALVSVKVTGLTRVAAGEPAVAVDISGSWAREHILRVLAHGLMDVYPNHTFQPGAMVRRGELAYVVGGVLDLLGGEPLPPLELPDMSPRHRYHRGASHAVQAGLMSLSAAGAFEPWRPVTGQEAVGVVDGLARRVGP